MTDVSKELYVANLTSSATDASVQHLFSTVGEIAVAWQTGDCAPPCRQRFRHFNQENPAREPEVAGVRHVSMGASLCGRPADSTSIRWHGSWAGTGAPATHSSRPRRVCMPALQTIGYERRPLSELIPSLQKARADAVIDTIRELATPSRTILLSCCVRACASIANAIPS